MASSVAELRCRLDGVIAFAPTPFDDEDQLDIDGFAEQIGFLCDTGACAIVVCGGVGEFYSLEAREHRALVHAAVEAAGHRMPVVAGVGQSTKIASQLAAYAAEAGADGIMVNPLYFLETTAAGLRRHFECVARASGLGIIVFNSRVQPYGLDVLEELAGVDAVVGVKDETRDLEQFQAARSAIGERWVFINGVAETFAGPYAAAGATAMTSGIVNVAPELTLAVWQLARDGRARELASLVERCVRPIADLRSRRPGYEVTVIKEAMNMCGLHGGEVRLPLLPLGADERAELHDALLRAAVESATLQKRLLG